MPTIPHQPASSPNARELTGRETLDSIEKALQDVSDHVTRLTAALDKANQDKARLVAQRLDAFEDLAEFRARLAVIDGVIDEADQLSIQVRTMLQARQKTLNGLKRRESQAQARRDQLLAVRKEIETEIDRMETSLDRVAERARQALMEDPDYRARVSRYEALTEIVGKAADKAAKSLAEEAEKGAPYRGDPLFMYLWERKYGTSAYQATGIVRWLDGWVARLIGYHDARANFAILTQIPKKLAEHVERLRESLKAEKAAIDSLEAKKIHDIAPPEFEAKLDAARVERDKHTAELDQINAELVETGNQLRIYAEGGDESFRQAIERTRDFLEGQQINVLLDEAQKTDDPADEKIISVIDKLADEIAALDKLARSKREELDKAFARKQELLRLAAEFRRARYDEPGSVFEPGSGTEVLLQQLLTGLITAAEYWARTQGNQRWRTRPGDSYRRGSSFPSGRGRSRGSSGPDFRTGGGF